MLRNDDHHYHYDLTVMKNDHRDYSRVQDGLECVHQSRDVLGGVKRTKRSGDLGVLLQWHRQNRTRDRQSDQSAKLLEVLPHLRTKNTIAPVN